jgi:hypothetical protein
MRWYGPDSSDRGRTPVEGSFQHGNEILVFIKCWEFLEWLNDLWLIKNTGLHGVTSLASLLLSPTREVPVFVARILVTLVSNDPLWAVIFVVVWDWVHLIHWPLFWHTVPAPDDRWRWVWNSRWNENRQGKPKYSEKICPSATLATTNPTWPLLGLNPAPALESRLLTAWAMARHTASSIRHKTALRHHFPEYMPS